MRNNIIDKAKNIRKKSSSKGEETNNLSINQKAQKLLDKAYASYTK